MGVAAHDSAVLVLCSTLDVFLDRYTLIRNKYYNGLGPERELDSAERSLESAFNELEKLTRPWK